MKEWIIRQVANGYIVVPAPDMSRSFDGRAGLRETHVFRTFAQASTWIKRQMEPVA